MLTRLDPPGQGQGLDPQGQGQDLDPQDQCQGQGRNFACKIAILTRIFAFLRLQHS